MERVAEPTADSAAAYTHAVAAQSTAAQSAAHTPAASPPHALPTSSSASLILPSAASAPSAPVKYFAYHTRRPRLIRKPRKKRVLSSDEDEEEEYVGKANRRRNKAESSSDSSSSSSDEQSTSSSGGSSSSGADSDGEKTLHSRKPRSSPARSVKKTVRKPASTVSSSSSAAPPSSVGNRVARLKIFRLFLPVVGATAAPLIERALFEKHGGTNAAYNAQVRELVSSLQLLKNISPPSSMLSDISLGVITPAQLVNMSAKELAPEDLRQQRETQEKQDLRDLHRPLEIAQSALAVKAQQQEEASTKLFEAITRFENSKLNNPAAAALRSIFPSSSSSVPALPPASLSVSFIAAPSLDQLPNLTHFKHAPASVTAAYKQPKHPRQQTAKKMGVIELDHPTQKQKQTTAAPPATAKAVPMAQSALAASKATLPPRSSASASKSASASSAASSDSSSDGEMSDDDELLIVTPHTAAKVKGDGVTTKPQTAAVSAVAAAKQSPPHKRKQPTLSATANATATTTVKSTGTLTSAAKLAASGVPTAAASAASKQSSSVSAAVRASSISPPKPPAAPTAASSASSSSIALAAESQSAKRARVSESPSAQSARSPANAKMGSSASISPMSHDEGERKSPPPLDADPAMTDDQDAEEINAMHPSDPLQMAVRDEQIAAANAVPAYSGQLFFALPRRGQLFISLHPLPVKDVFPASVCGSGDSARLCAEGVLSKWDANCWSHILPSELSNAHRMKAAAVERYIHFKANSHTQPSKHGSVPSASIQAASRLYPVSFVLRSTEPLLSVLERDMSLFHRTNKLALALDFESSSFPPSRQCVLWLMPPGSLQFLTQKTATEVLHWQSHPRPDEWWGIMWVKAFAWKAMRKSADAAKRRAQAELDVPSDSEENGAADASMDDSKSASAAASVAPEHAPATSSDVLQLIQDPNKIASTASYLNNLLHKISKVPDAAMAVSAAGAATTAGAAAPTAAAAPSVSSLIASIRNAAKKHLQQSGAGAAVTTATAVAPLPIHPLPSAEPPLQHSAFQHTPAMPMYAQPIAPQQPPIYAAAASPSSAWQSSAPLLPLPQPQPSVLGDPYAAYAPAAVPSAASGWQSTAFPPAAAVATPAPLSPQPFAEYAAWNSQQQNSMSTQAVNANAGWQSVQLNAEQQEAHAAAPAASGWQTTHLRSTLHPSRAHVFQNSNN